MSVAQVIGRIALTAKIAKALHADSNMRSVRWCDLGPIEKKFRMDQADIAIKTIARWAKEQREPLLNLMDDGWLGAKEKE